MQVKKATEAPLAIMTRVQWEALPISNGRSSQVVAGILWRRKEGRAWVLCEYVPSSRRGMLVVNETRVLVSASAVYPHTEETP